MEPQKGPLIGSSVRRHPPLLLAWLPNLQIRVLPLSWALKLLLLRTGILVSSPLLLLHQFTFAFTTTVT